MVKIVGLIGSPRKNGNTEVLINEALKGASDAGAKTEVFRLCDMNINPCRACANCRSHGSKCTVDDDMPILYDRLKYSDAFILGSPVYFGSMSAQSKIFIERLYAITSNYLNWKNFWENYGKKDISLIFTQANPDETLFKGYFANTAKVFEHIGFNMKDILVTGGNQEIGEVKNRKDVLKEASVLGSKLAKKIE